MTSGFSSPISGRENGVTKMRVIGELLKSLGINSNIEMVTIQVEEVPTMIWRPENQVKEEIWPKGKKFVSKRGSSAKSEENEEGLGKNQIIEEEMKILKEDEEI